MYIPPLLMRSCSFLEVKCHFYDVDVKHAYPLTPYLPFLLLHLDSTCQEGDGNCFWRALARNIAGNPEPWQEVKRLVLQHMSGQGFGERFFFFF
jgi:hypothetical protein